MTSLDLYALRAHHNAMLMGSKHLALFVQACTHMSYFHNPAREKENSLATKSSSQFLYETPFPLSFLFRRNQHMQSFCAFCLIRIRLKLVKKTLRLEEEDNLVDGSSDAGLADVNGELGIARGLVRGVDTSEVLNLTGASLLVDTALVSLLAVLERSGDVNEVEGTVLLDSLAGGLSALGVGSDGGGDNGGTSTGEFRGDETDTGDVAVAVFLAEAELLAQLVADVLTEKKRDRATTLLVESDVQSAGNGVLARVGVTGKEDGETLLVAGRVGLAKDTDDLGVREPLGNVTSSAETATKLSARDVESPGALGNLVTGLVDVVVGKVGHLLELDNLDTELLAVLLNHVLGLVWTVDVLAVPVLSGTSVVTTDNEVRGTVVLTDDSVPKGLTRTTHTHGKTKETENGHTVRVTGEKGLVDTDTGEVVNVSGLGKTNNGVDENVGLTVTGGANSQLTMSAVHGVTGLESDNSGPAKLVEVETQLSGGVSESNVVVVHQTVNGLKLATNVVVTGRLEKVLDGRVVRRATKDLLGLNVLVGLVDILDSDDGEVTVVSEVTESNASTRLRTGFLDNLLADIKVDGHGEKVAICEAVVVANTGPVLLGHETCEDTIVSLTVLRQSPNLDSLIVDPI